MRKDGYYEESAVSAKATQEAKKYLALQIISYVFLVAGILFTFFTLYVIPATLESLTTTGQKIFAVVQLLLFLAAFYGCFVALTFLKKRFNVSYDYLFVQDELRVSKVFNGKKRKYLKKIEAAFVMSIGWVESDSFERLRAGYSKKDIVVYTPNAEPVEGKEFFYLVYSTSQEKSLYILEARKELLEYLVPAVGLNKLERK